MANLRRAIVAWRVWRTAGAILHELRAGGSDVLDSLWDGLPEGSQREVREIADRLEEADVRAVFLGEADYPSSLAALKSPPPILFMTGNTELLDRRAIGLCGSRAVSAEGSRAAAALAQAVAGSGDVVVAGNAQGVDAEAQGAALAADGSVITVLPEGIEHFRFRTGSADHEASPHNVLAISSFPPWQPWTVGGAMSRNDVIIGLSSVLVVIEAGERGGTLAAGEAALKMGRSVVALRYGDRTPPGNLLLLGRGARPATTPREVYEVVESLNQEAGVVETAQLPLAF